MAHCEKVWVDSDVLLDWLGGREPWDVAATELIERAVLGHWELWFSPLTLANLHYIYRKQAGSSKAMVAIESLVQMGNIATMEAAHVMQALASGHLDFEDEMQMACASSLTDLAAIITRNLPDYEHGALPAMSADAWIQLHPLPPQEAPPSQPA